MGEPARPVAGTELDLLPPMTHYVFGLLRRPPHRPELGPADAEAVQEGHLAHLRHLREAGDLITSGPFEEDTELRGILIFRTSSVAKARELMRADPGLRSGVLVLDLYTWYAPAGLQLAGTGVSGPTLSFETD
jgi:uncharacterized protein